MLLKCTWKYIEMDVVISFRPHLIWRTSLHSEGISFLIVSNGQLVTLNEIQKEFFETLSVEKNLEKMP